MTDKSRNEEKLMMVCKFGHSVFDWPSMDRGKLEGDGDGKIGLISFFVSHMMVQIKVLLPKIEIKWTFYDFDIDLLL